MSREIKFRAWHSGVMVPWEVLVELITKTAFSKNLMQYTGLKDRTGTEWWEGDIITPDDNEDGSIAEIIFAGGAFRKKYNNWRGQQDPETYPLVDDIDLEIFIVAGNIYENGELLKND